MDARADPVQIPGIFSKSFHQYYLLFKAIINVSLPKIIYRVRPLGMMDLKGYRIDMYLKINQRGNCKAENISDIEGISFRNSKSFAHKQPCQFQAYLHFFHKSSLYKQHLRNSMRVLPGRHL